MTHFDDEDDEGQDARADMDAQEWFEPLETQVGALELPPWFDAGGGRDSTNWPGEAWANEAESGWADETAWLEADDCAREWLAEVATAIPSTPDPKDRTPSVKIPNINAGLGKSQAKRDLVALERLVCEKRQWMVYRRQLCCFIPPCWVALDEHMAEVEIRRLLQEHRFDECLGPGDYKELRRLLMLKPELQRYKDFDTPECHVNLIDGTLDVLTGEVRPHDPKDGFFSYLDMTLEEVSQAEGGEDFEAFICQAANGNGDIRRQLLELVGIVAAGCSVKNFFVLVGPSHTGKTQFGRFLEELVGRKYVETLRGIDDFGDKWTMGALYGKKLVTCLDLPDEPLSNKAVGSIKQLVGDDSVKGEFKRGALFTFYEKPLLVCAGNFPVRVPNMEKEQALLNRMVVVPFFNPVEADGEVQHFYKKLLDERAYIVSHALDALRELEKRNFQVTRVPVPEEYMPEEGRHNLRAVQDFLARECTVKVGAEVTTEELTQAYSLFSGAVPISDTEFSRLFSQAVQALEPTVQSLKRACGGEKRGYRGLTLYN